MVPSPSDSSAEDLRRSVPSDDGTEPELFDRLRAVRKELAGARGVPAYVVFSDRTLQEMALQAPRTLEEMLNVHGVGQKKLEEYGERFLAEIRRGH